MILTEDYALEVYNFVNDWKNGRFGEVDLQSAIDDNFGMKVCCICGKEFKGWGNNPWPVKEDGECCNSCNSQKVIPARIAIHMKGGRR